MHPFLEISLVLKEQDNRSAQRKNQGAKAKSIILAVEYESVEVPDWRPIIMDNNNRPFYMKSLESSSVESPITEEKKEKVEQNPPTIEELLAIEKDKNLRLFAEFENFRKRTAKERIALFATAGKDIMSILLPILDDMERAIQANEYDEKHGVFLIYNKLKSSLESEPPCF